MSEERPPSADEFFGPAPKQLPTADDFFGPQKPLKGGFWDRYFTETPTGALLSGFGQGFEQEWGATMKGVPEVEDYLRKNGLWNDYNTQNKSAFKSFNEALMRPQIMNLAEAVGAVRGVMGGIYGGLRGAAEAPGVAPSAVPDPLQLATGGAVARLESMGPEAGGVTGLRLRELPGVAAPLARARDLGVIGEGEAGWKGVGEAPTVTEAERAESTKAAIRALEPSQERPPEAVSPAEEPPPTPTAPAPNIHAVAREIAPDTFSEYDALDAQRETNRRLLDDLKGGREVDDLDRQIQETRGRALETRGAERRALTEQISAMEEHRAELAEKVERGVDTPYMEEVRKEIQRLDYRMRDMAPDVSAAYRAAEARVGGAPAEAVPAAPTVVPEAPAAAAAPTVTPAIEGAPAAPAAAPEGIPFMITNAQRAELGARGYTPEQIHNMTPAQAQEVLRAPAAAAPAPAGEAPAPRIVPAVNIAEDVSRQLVAAGRPAEEANAAGQLTEATYRSFAARLSGGMTAEELYATEAPTIRAGRVARAREYAERQLYQAASETKGHPEGEAEDAAWRRLEPETTAAGGLRGAPDWVTTRRHLGRLRGLIRQLVGEGEPGRFWYEDSAQRIMQITRGNLADAEKMMGLVAIYSPQTPVFTNMNFAIKAYEQWRRGEPINVKTGIQDAKALAWLEHGEDWGGRKTNSFYLNLMHDLITDHPEAIKDLNIPDDVLSEVKRATVDLWVLRAFGYNIDAAGGPSEGAANKYGFAEREIQRLTGMLNRDLPDGARRWLPHQVQAALWSAVKARYELPAVKEATWGESLNAGFAKWVPDEKGTLQRTAPGKYGPDRQGHMAIWRKHALQAKPEDVARQVETAKGSFGDAIGRVAQNVTAEVVPSASLAHPIGNASRAARERFTREGLSLITDDDGNDVLAAQLGVNLNYSHIGAGLFEGSINPTVVTTLVPEKPAGIFDATKARQYARAWQYIFRQDAVPFFRADQTIDFAGDFSVRNAAGRTLRKFNTLSEAQAYSSTRTGTSVAGGKFSRGVHLEFGADLDEAAQQRLSDALREVLGPDAGFTKTGDREAAIINFRGDDGLPFVDDDHFAAAIKQLTARDDIGIGRVSHFGSEGEYGPIHNWQAEPTGGALPAAAGGSPAFQAWLRDRHAAFGKLLDDWRDPERAAAEGRAAEPDAGGARGGETLDLEQARRGAYRLASNFARSIVTLFKDADASTFIHESGHHWLEMMLKFAADPRASADLVADASMVREWLGAEPEAAITRAQHEKFARGFERYMMEGRAPSTGLGGVFAKFKQWLTQIYQTVTRLRAPINDDIRGVFDRMLTTPEERAVVAPERLSDVGMPDLEREAETIPPEHAADMADRVAAETLRRALERDPELADELTRGPAGAGREAGAEPPAGGATDRGATATAAVAGEVGANERARTDVPGREPIAPQSTGAPGRPGDDPAIAGEPFAGPRNRAIDKAGNIRLDKLNQPDDIDQVIRDAASRNNDFLAERRGKLSEAEQIDLADAMGLDPAFLDGKKIGQAFNTEEIRVVKRLLIQSARGVREAMLTATSGAKKDVLALAEAIARHEMIQGKVAQATAEWGRAGHALNAVMEGSAEAEDLNQFLKANTGRSFDQLKQMAEYGQSLRTPGQMGAFVNNTAAGKIKRAIIYYYVNALISGPMTHARYSVGNAINALWTPLVEIPVAATYGGAREALGLATQGDRVYLGEAGAQLYGLIKGTQEGLKAGYEAARTGISPYLPGEKVPQLLEPSTVPIPGIAGTTIGLPSRGVAAIHSFFKAIRYEQNIQSLAYRQAMIEGLEGDARDARIAELTQRPTEAMQASATSNALKELYMSPTEYESAMGALTRFANRSFFAKIVMPFLKIGTQITRNAWIERTPLGIGSDAVREALMSNSANFDMAAAKMTAGIGLIGATVMMAAEGLATGDGPTDPAQRRTWLLSHKPNSLQIGNVSIPYQGLGHLGMLMRFSANMYETAHAWDGEDGGKLAVAGLKGIVSSVLDDNFLRGAKDMLDAVYHPEEYGTNYLKNMVTNWLPFSVGMGQVAREVDPYQRESQGIFEAIKARIPWVSETLYPRRDVYGEPIPSAGTYRNYANDPVSQELEKVGYGIGRLERKIRGVELTEQQYDDYARIAGRLVRQRLTGQLRLLQSLPPKHAAMIIKETVDASRETARSLIMMQNPDIIRSAVKAKTLMLTE